MEIDGENRRIIIFYNGKRSYGQLFKNAHLVADRKGKEYGSMGHCLAEEVIT